MVESWYFVMMIDFCEWFFWIEINSGTFDGFVN